MSNRYPIAALFLFLAASSCSMFGMPAEKKKKLSQFQSQAAYYYEGQRYEQALESVRRGLEIVPDDYKLMSVGARCLMITSETRPEHLVQAEALYDRVLASRSLDNQATHALLGYAQCQKLLAATRLQRAGALEKRAESNSRTDLEKTQALTAAAEHRKKAASHEQRAERMFLNLIERDEQPRIAHQNLMDLKVEQKDWDGAIHHGTVSLRLNSQQQTRLSEEIDRTNVFGWEQEKRAERLRLNREARVIRRQLGRIYFQEKKDYQNVIAQVTALLEDDPTVSIDYYNRGMAFERADEVKAACSDYQKFISTNRLAKGNDKVMHAYRFTQKHSR